MSTMAPERSSLHAEQQLQALKYSDQGIVHLPLAEFNTPNPWLWEEMSRLDLEQPKSGYFQTAFPVNI